MQTLWFSLRWAVRQLTFLVTLFIASIALLLLPMGLVVDLSQLPARVAFKINLSVYWKAVSSHLSHLMQGQLLPPPQSLPAGSPLGYIQESLATTLPVTLRLFGTALVASLVVGLILGALISGLGPRLWRGPLWSVTTLLYSIPDLLIATFMSLAVLIVAIIRGTGPLRLSETWHDFGAPAVALTLIALPYVARVTATAIDETTGELFIRAAVAKGVHPLIILVKHVGKNVLVRVSAILPVVVGMLFSGGAVVEYMMERHGVGRALIMNVGPRTMDRYAGVIYLLPMLLLFTAAIGLASLIQRWLDPRIAALGAGAGVAQATERVALGRSLAELQSLPTAVWAGVRSLIGALWAGVRAFPAYLRKGLRDPVLLSGLVLVLGLVFVAVAAPWLAPHDPAQTNKIIIGPGDLIRIPPFPPSPDYWLGTDELGRDVLSQLLYGTRYALLFALLAAPARFLLAVPFGLLAAYRGGLWARLIRWLTTFFTAVPLVILPLALIPAANLLFRDRPGDALFWGVTLIALPGAPRLAGSVQNMAAEVLAQPFVEGAQAVGAGTSRTLFRYLLPAMLPQLVTMLTLEVPSVMTLTALLGYFGAYPGGAIFETAGFHPIAPLIPEWGSLMVIPLMLLMTNRWWQWAPYVALFVAVLAFNLLGEGLRRVLASRTGWKWQG